MTTPSFALLQYILRAGYLVRMEDQSLEESEAVRRFQDRLDERWRALSPEDMDVLRELAAKDDGEFRAEREGLKEGLPYR